MGEIDVAFLGLPLIAHHIDFIAGLNLRLALMVKHFGQGQHALGLGANVNDDVSGSELQHSAFEDVVLAGLLFLYFRGERFKGGCEVFG